MEFDEYVFSKLTKPDAGYTGKPLRITVTDADGKTISSHPMFRQQPYSVDEARWDLMRWLHHVARDIAVEALGWKTDGP